MRTSAVQLPLSRNCNRQLRIWIHQLSVLLHITLNLWSLYAGSTCTSYTRRLISAIARRFHAGSHDLRNSIFVWSSKLLFHFTGTSADANSWKTFLPAKWRDPEVPPEATTALDPNMSLAHITHNTSMILLHQRIGYPEPQLKGIKLPNMYSAETCQSAAVETANIARNYLARAPERMPLSPHFSFCAYISARVLLGMSFGLYNVY